MINIFIFAILMTASCWAKQIISHPNENQKIVGGEDAEQGQFPYQVHMPKLIVKFLLWLLQ